VLRSHRAAILTAAFAFVAAPASPADHATPAPSFSIRTVDGKWMRMTDLRGRPVVLDFWATWCAPCKSSMPHLSAIQSRYRDRGLVVLGLSMDDDDAQAVRKFADRLGLTFRVALADDHVIDEFGPVRGLPTTIFIDRHGDIVRRVTGYLDQETIEGYVRELF
jgi:cytochrome c biogenesis protein CcmG/thiol:disulfide interchange protein DsbE